MQGFRIAGNCLLIVCALASFSWDFGVNKVFQVSCSLVIILSALTHAVCDLKGAESERWRGISNTIGSVFATVVAGGMTLFVAKDIMRDGNSTAAIALIFLPFVYALLWPFLYCVGWMVGFIKEMAARQSKRLRAAAAASTLLVMVCVSLGFIEAKKIYEEKRLIDQIAHMNAAELEATLHDKNNDQRRWVLNALVSNPAMSREDLFYVAHLQQPQLHERGRPTIVPNAGNTKGLAVMRLVAMHPNVGVESLEVLSKSKDPYVRSSVVANLKSSEELVKETLSATEDFDVVKFGLQERQYYKAARATEEARKERPEAR